MKVEVLDGKRRRLRVRPEGDEDLWTLMSILRPGDYVKGRTTRDVSVKGGGRKERRPITVKLRVENVEFQPFTGRLRVYGVIVEGPEEYGVQGRHHALTVAPGQEVIIEREDGWPEWAVEKLRASGPRGRALVVAVDYDEYGVALVAPHGFKMVTEGSSSLPGKDSPTREQEFNSYIERVAKLAAETAAREGVEVVVVTGPGEPKRLVAERLRALAPNLKVFTDDASMGGRAGVEEALRRPRVTEALREYTLVEAEKVLDEAMRLLARNPDRVAYTLGEVAAAAKLGAIEACILVSDKLHSLDEKERELAVTILEWGEKTRARVYLVPPDSPVGEKVARLGGAVAVLRYPLPHPIQ
ncbi:pelota family protein [Stetteria hydrogenophila]